MPPSSLAILIGAGPTTGSGIARILASPAHGNMAVALLSRTADPTLTEKIAQSCHGGPGTLREFRTDTSEAQLTTAFAQIREWSTTLSPDLKLAMSIYNVKHSHKTAFEDETAARYTESLTTYATGAMVFAQLSITWMLSQYPSAASDASPGKLQKKGTLIFTGTLGSLRTNPGFAAYGASRASVRMLAQSLAREFSGRGVHVVHAIANGGITDAVRQDRKSGLAGGDSVAAADGDEEEVAKVARGERMRAESVGRLYLACALQDVDLWVHELDMRPAAEKF